MKALMYTAPRELRVLAVDEPRGSCVVRVGGCAICGTDLKTFLHGHPYFKPPVILGHEFYGTVEKAPEGCGVKPGDPVVVAPYGECGECADCLAGHGEMCGHKSFIATGAFCELIEVPESFIRDGVIRLDALDSAYALTEPLACVLCAIDQLRFHGGSRALVVGGGPMGALLAFALADMGKEVSVVEPNPKRLSHLRAWGVDCYESGDADFGYRDNILIAVNKPELVSFYMEKVAGGGTLHVFAGMPSGSRLDVDAGAIHYRGVTLTGSSGFALRHFHRAYGMIHKNPDHFRRLLTHEFSLDEGEAAFRTFESGEAFKVLLKP